MAAQGIVVLPDKEPNPTERTIIPKLFGSATGDSIMIFEEIVPPGTKSTRHCTATVTR
ncbi:MAG TPA: hypothetical protein VNV38_12390 [Stellaceae bacterium]|jgi:hypothetical protein|nr:hypothetical protein [Stellaceae bacterium]